MSPLDPHDVTRRRRMPDGARFAHVSDLFELPVEPRPLTVVWCGGSGSPDWSSGWMPLDRLLDYPPHPGEASLVACPSSLVVIVADRKPHERHETLTCDEVGCAEGGER